MVYVERTTLTNRRLMTPHEIEALLTERCLKYAARGSVRGYTTRVPEGLREVWDYKGRYGEGIAHTTPRLDSTNYSYLEYFVK